MANDGKYIWRYWHLSTTLNSRYDLKNFLSETNYTLNLAHKKFQYFNTLCTDSISNCIKGRHYGPQLGMQA